MDQFKNILVAVDFSLCSAAALKQAVRIAALNRARVSALHVVEIPMYALPEGSFLPIDLLPPVDLLLSESRERWAQWPPAREVGRSVTFECVLGHPRMELLARARSVDLFAIGAHGDFDTKRGIGSIAGSCVQRAGTKVLVVRHDQNGPFKSVVACVDFSETSKLAVEQAVRIAAQDGAALHILHVYTDPWHGLGPPIEIKTNLPDINVRYQQSVERHLRSFCESLAHEMRALKAVFHVEQFDKGGHGKGIVDFVARKQCDLVVLGTRSKWNVRDFFWGSTAERVVREAPCAALTIPPLESSGN
jgi:universal stress protein E